MSIGLAVLIVAVSSFLLVTIAITFIRTGVPTIASAKAAQLQVAEYLRKRNALRIYELGAGKGDFALRIAQYNPQAQVDGFELSLVPFLFSLFLKRFMKGGERTRFHLANFHDVDLREIDAVAMYLMPAPNRKLQPKLLKEMKPGSVVASVSFSMPGWKPQEVMIAPNISKTRTFIYHMPPTLVR
jgi:ubiquinone/menaquinone biosynthesis C-methylase UbiE